MSRSRIGRKFWGTLGFILGIIGIAGAILCVVLAYHSEDTKSQGIWVLMAIACVVMSSYGFKGGKQEW